jgi:hypothetical protein
MLGISVLYRGWAIPVAWTVLPATGKHAWRGEWLRMLHQMRAAVPLRFFVIVLADRGLYARWLFQGIIRNRWHPVLRINTGGTFRPTTSAHYQPLRSVVPLQYLPRPLSGSAHWFSSDGAPDLQSGEHRTGGFASRWGTSAHRVGRGRFVFSPLSYCLRAGD